MLDVMVIPSHIPKLTYTKHARFEQCKEMLGFIAAVPSAFYRVGCKRVEPKDESHFRATYIYDDQHDLHLVIDLRDSTVVTNYLKRADNRGVYKGRFRIGRSL